jgi:hypothetical protein
MVMLAVVVAVVGSVLVGREKRESTKLDYERKVKTLLKMLERANKCFGPELTFANLIYW